MHTLSKSHRFTLHNTYRGFFFHEVGPISPSNCFPVFPPGPGFLLNFPDNVSALNEGLKATHSGPVVQGEHIASLDGTRAGVVILLQHYYLETSNIYFWNDFLTYMYFILFL